MNPSGEHSNGTFGRIGSVVVLALTWELLAHLKHDVRLFPSFESIIKVSLPSLGIFSQTGEPGYLAALGVLAWHSLITVGRIVIALAVGVPVGIVFGLTIHYLRGFGPISAVTLMFVRSVPLLALIPLFEFWFGASQSGIFAYIVFGIIVVTSSDSYEAAANLQPVYVQQARLLGANGSFLFRTIYLPGIESSLFASLRNVIGLSWAFALGAEYISATSGLGYVVYQSYLYSDMGKLAVLSLVYVVLGYLSFRITQRLFGALVPWRSEKTGEAMS